MTVRWHPRAKAEYVSLVKADLSSVMLQNLSGGMLPARNAAVR